METKSPKNNGKIGKGNEEKDKKIEVMVTFLCRFS